MHDWKASIDRLFKMLAGSKKLDKVPYFALVLEQMIARIGGFNIKVIYSNPKLYAKAVIMVNEFFNTDIVSCPTVYAGPGEAIAWAEANDKKSAIKYFDDRPPYVEQGVICKTEADIENLKIPDHSQIKIWDLTFKAAKLILEKTGFPQCVGTGIWSAVQQLRGVQAYRDMRQNPEILLTLCEKIFQSQIDVYNNWIEKVGRSPFIFYAGYAFNATMMSYEDAMKYEGNFIKRYQKEIPFPFILHNCGMKPYWNVCDEIKVVAVNGSHPLDLDFWVDFKKKYRSISILGATIDVSREMLTGTPSDVEELVKENIFKLAPEGRYAVSPICALPKNVPLPNIMAVSNAIEKYGHYPIE